MPPRKTPIDRAISKIKIQPNGCWIWTGYMENGYGRFKLNGKHVQAHRFFYNFEHTEFPINNKDLKNSLDHLCRNRACRNPEHMERVTTRKNAIRGKISALNKNKTSKYAGVCWNKQTGKWKAQIYVDGKSRHLGRFNNEKEAAFAYQAALKEII